MLLNARQRQLFRIESSRIRRVYSSSRKRNKKKSVQFVCFLRITYVTFYTSSVACSVFIMYIGNQQTRHINTYRSLRLQCFSSTPTHWKYLITFWFSIMCTIQFLCRGFCHHSAEEFRWSVCQCILTPCVHKKNVWWPRYGNMFIGRYVDLWVFYYVKVYLTELSASIERMHRESHRPGGKYKSLFDSVYFAAVLDIFI